VNREFVSFYLAGQHLGIPVEDVQEVLPSQPVASVPLAPKVVAGLLNLRGQIVTAISLRERLGISSQPGLAEGMNIVVSEHEELFSLQVDSVGDVIAVEEELFAPPPSTLESKWKECCSGVYRLKETLLIVMNLKAILSVSENS
jgi:purine-binding chemotaxis protein CheW